jgi:hypothetical protein
MSDYKATRNHSPSGHAGGGHSTNIHQKGMHNKSPSAKEPHPKGPSVNVGDRPSAEYVPNVGAGPGPRVA